MTERTHEDLVSLGLLDGRMDKHARAKWPAWAREHFETCLECRALRHIEMLVIEESHLLLRDPGAGDELPPFLPLGRHEAADASPPPIDILLDSHAPFAEERNYRGGALDLTRTEGGVHAWDPDATHLALFKVQARQATVLGSAAHERPGVTVAANVSPDSEMRIVAVATCAPIDLDMWEMWLGDVARHGWPGRLDPGVWVDRVHLAEIMLRPRPAAWLLRVQPGVLPDPTAPVRELTQPAAAAGRAGEPRKAASLYAKGLARAFSLADNPGEITSALGLSASLDALGYGADAERVLTSLIDRSVFDAKLGGKAARRLAWHSLATGSPDGLHRWRAEAERIEGPSASWLSTLDAANLLLEERWKEALEVTEACEPSGLTSEAKLAIKYQRAIGLAGVGRVPEAEGVLAAHALPDLHTLELALWRVTAMAAIRRDDEAWGAVVADVQRALRGRTTEMTAWEGRLLIELARLAIGAGAEPDAWALFRLRFLPLSRALDSAVALFGVAGAGDAILACDPSGAKRLRQISLSRQQLVLLCARAREAVVGHAWGSDAVATLRALLLPKGWPVGLQALVASDGALAGLPLEALARSNPRAPVPYQRECPPADVGSEARPTGADVASLADSLRDLPWADREVAPSEARLHLRGSEVTRQALQSLGAVGLLHLGLHARREGGVPGLVFADGRLSPPEIEEMQLPGAPVVLLSGCATGEAAVPHGLERSFARAFLRAGASAVIATRWPVEDAEMYLFVRELLALWPFEDAAQTVTDMKNKLRNEGKPARLWAAPVVY